MVLIDNMCCGVLLCSSSSYFFFFKVEIYVFLRFLKAPSAACIVLYCTTVKGLKLQERPPSDEFFTFLFFFLNSFSDDSKSQATSTFWIPSPSGNTTF